MAQVVKNVLLEVLGQTEGAQQAVQNIGDEIRRLPNARTVTVTAEVDRAERSIKDMRRELQRIDRATATPEVNVAVSKALADLSGFQAALRAIPNNKRVDIEVRTKVERDLANIERGVRGVTDDLDRANRPARTFGQVMGDLGGTLKSVGPLLRGTAILVGTQLVAGVLALAASAASAIGGIVLLGNALIFALGPAVALAIAVAKRIAKVLDALKAQDEAKDAAQRDTAAGSAAAAAAAKERENAESSLRDALEGVTSAERSLGDARKAAAQEIVEANRRAAEAQAEVREAAAAVRGAFVDAYRAMADAAESVTDAIRGVARAQLGIDQADLGTREAKDALADYRRELGLTEKALTDVFDKFTDVDFQFDRAALGKALGGAKGADGKKPSGDEEREIERLILAIREAKLGERDATDSLSDSERDLSDARSEQTNFQRQGVRAYEPLRDAIASQRDAQRAANEASAEARALERRGIAQAPQVIAAAEGLRDAEQRLAQARRDVKTAGDTVVSPQALKAKEATDKLTAAEMRFLNVLKQVRSELTGFLGPATDAVFGAMTRALSRLPKLLNPLRGAFTQLGRDWASVIDTFSLELIKPEWTKALRVFVQQSGVLARILIGDAFIQFLRIMRNLALVTMPLLVDLSRGLADYLRRVAKNTGDLGQTAGPVNAMIESFKAWMGLLGAIIDFFISLAGVSSEAGDGIVKWLTDGVKAMTKFMRSAEGQKKVRQFFEDTVPAVKSVVVFLAKLAVVFLKVFQAASPAIDAIVDGLNIVADVVIFLLDQINKIPAPFRAALGIVGSAVGALRGGLLAVQVGVKGVTVALGFLLAALGTIGLISKSSLEAVWGFFKRLVKRIIGLFEIGSPSKLFIRIGKAIGQGLLGGLRAFGGALFEAGKRLLGRAVAGVRAVAVLMLRAAKFVGVKLIAGVLSLGGRLVALGATVVAKIRDGIVKVASRVRAGARAIYDKIAAFFSGAGGRLKDVGADIVGGIAQGVKDAARVIFDAIRSLFGRMIRVAEKVLDIGSPSKRFQTIGKQMVQGLAKGLADNERLATDRVHKLFDDMPDGKEFTFKGVQFMKEGRPKKSEWREGDNVGYKRWGIRKLEGGPVVNPGGLFKTLGGTALAEAAKRYLPDIPYLAAGGVTTGPTLATIGEAGREAVLPLSRSVMRELARAIAAEMRFPAPAAGGAAGLRAARPQQRSPVGGIHIARQDVNMPPAPAAQVPDGRYQAAQFAREMRRRGRGGRS